MIRKILPFKRDIIISSNYKKNVAALSTLIHVYSQRDFLHKRIIRFYPFILKKKISYLSFILYIFPPHILWPLLCWIFYMSWKEDLEGLWFLQFLRRLAVFAVLNLEVPNLGVLFMSGCKLIRFHFMCEDHFQAVDLNILFAWNTQYIMHYGLLLRKALKPLSLRDKGRPGKVHPWTIRTVKEKPESPSSSDMVTITISRATAA